MSPFQYNNPSSGHYNYTVHYSSPHITSQPWGLNGLFGHDSFLDWLDILEIFFAYHNLSDSRKIYHANMSLFGSTMTCWRSYLRNYLNQFTVTLWDEMK